MPVRQNLDNLAEVIVVGAGLAGLSTAIHLAERGIPPLVLEAHPEFAGGRVSGGVEVEIDGWRFRGEHGVHGIWSPYRNLQALLARHKIRPMFVPALEETWIYKRGSKVKRARVGTAIRFSPLPAPLHYLNLFMRPRFLGMLGIRDWLSLPLVWWSLLWGVGIDPFAEDQPLKDLRLSYLVKRWSPAVRAFFVGLARNGMAAEPEEIPLSGFIAFLRFYTLLRRDSWAYSYMPADGGSSLVEPLIQKLESMGSEIQMGTRVLKITKREDSWRIDWQSEETAIMGYSLTKQIVLATDAPNTSKIVANSPDMATKEELFWPRGMATAVVRIWFDKSPTPGAEGGIFSGDFVIHNFFWLHIIQDQYRRWHRATRGSAIEVHIYGPPELLEQSDAVLLTRAISDVQSAFPELRGHRIHQIIERNDATQTLFGLGSKERHLSINTPWTDIFCCGDWVRHPTPAFFLERACVTGLFAANAVLESRGLEQWPHLEYPKPETFAAFIERLMRRGRRSRRKKRREAP
ncbi:MAG: FAD-dependent oxidoreductase [Chloroflexi bacterium]|nr:FAD-dependent oxidoreductase [Chloroflexota bacterium]